MSHTAVPSIYPALRYQDAHAAIDWLCQAFGFERHVVFDAPDGSIGRAELQMGTAVVGLSSIGPVVAANPWSSVKQGLYVCLAEVDALHERARATGADIVMPLKIQDYGSMHLGPDTLMIGSAPKDEALWNGHDQTASVHVPDPDQHFARASAAGAVIVRPIETTSYGARGYVARDIEGFVWNFSNYQPSA